MDISIEKMEKIALDLNFACFFHIPVKQYL